MEDLDVGDSFTTSMLDILVKVSYSPFSIDAPVLNMRGA